MHRTTDIHNKGANTYETMSDDSQKFNPALCNGSSIAELSRGQEPTTTDGNGDTSQD